LKKFVLLTFAAAALFATAGGASAQVYYSGPGYGVHLEPRYDRDYDDRRYRRDRHHQDRYSFNGCPRHYTVQDGVCKPYRGY
jgi:hypothetical protein